MMDGLLPSTQAEVELLSRQSGLSGRQVERWFRRRRNQDRPSLLKKFREARWGRLGEVGGAEESLMYLAGRGGPWLCAGRDVTQVRSVWFFMTFLRISGVLEGLCPSPTPLS